ncbi:MAG: hypothetical protein U9N46_06975 [Euryarchaeota archaeon]|nr:hypothetical protein [Euryarchaeota archaeon]
MGKRYDDAARCDDVMNAICATMIPIAKPVTRSAEIDSVADGYGCSRAGKGGCWSWGVW